MISGCSTGSPVATSAICDGRCTDDETGAQLLSVQLDNRPAEACEFGAQTSGVLKKLKADKNPRLALLHKDMIQFLKRSSKYLQDCLCRTSSC